MSLIRSRCLRACLHGFSEEIFPTLDHRSVNPAGFCGLPPWTSRVPGGKDVVLGGILILPSQ